MKDLEDRVIPTVGEMMLDEPATLSVEQRHAIVGWAVKTAMVFEHVSRHKVIFYTDDERAAFKNERIVPAETAVWLARTIAGVSFYSRGNDASSDGQGGGLHGYFTTFTYGRLVVQVATLRTAGLRGTIQFPTAQRWQPFTVRIWPNVTEPVQWPAQTAGTILEPGLDEFHRRFAVVS
jgi:hypothetical protein